MSYFKKISTRGIEQIPQVPTQRSGVDQSTGGAKSNKRKASEMNFDVDPELDLIDNAKEDVWKRYRFTQADREDLSKRVREYATLFEGVRQTVHEPRAHDQSHAIPTNQAGSNDDSLYKTLKTNGSIRKTRTKKVYQAPTRFSARIAAKKRKLADVVDDNDSNDSTNRAIVVQRVPDTQNVSAPSVQNAPGAQESNNMLCWVSATKTKNYLLGDQCVDWLAMYYEKFGITSDLLTPSEQEDAKKYIKDASHLSILLEGGNTFERKVYVELKDIYKEDFVIVFSESDMDAYRAQRSIGGIIREGYEKVRSLMRKGVPIIAQAPLINDDNQTYGVADILIRSDYLSTFFKIFSPDADIHVKAPMLDVDARTGLGYHYRVIDCKWTTMVLCVDGLTIRNEGYFPAYKGQLAVYTACLEKLQGYVPTKAYIMSKAWRIDKTGIPDHLIDQYRGYSAFDRPGVIDYAGRDIDYLERTKNAVIWIQKMMTEGRNWRYHPDAPSVPDMYPNMTKAFNPMYDKIKASLAKRYKDPTLVWYVGADHRKNAHAQGVMGINDQRCTSSLMGITNARGRIINAILDINRQSDDNVRPLCIKNNMADWQNEKALDYYVDFETINYNLYIRPDDMDVDNSYIDSDVTFMIGVGFLHDPQINSRVLLESLGVEPSRYNFVHKHDVETGWEFVCLYLTEFKVQNELEIFRLFFDFIISRGELHRLVRELPEPDESRLFHWTGAEIRFINRAISRILSGKYVPSHMQNSTLALAGAEGAMTNEEVHQYLTNLVDLFEQRSKWVDMYKVFESEPIVVKGSYRFKLKHIGNAFHSHGLIDTKWDDGKMSDGFRAMLEAITLYRSNPHITEENPMYKEIIDYNEIDCRVIWEIVTYLRDNHCVPLDDSAMDVV
ncbi:hypothetical protein YASMINEVIRUS_294 [Yasminevirus sp. GU-2018]|uniref:Uncharacterized protein n=1 Tax=Yasminevirus sp. GU-2018 TaxID=2420051 RepID=A0A5K0U8I2_9VIRU|nr:hypothetical protein YASMINEVIRUS_294 [Yasminevirus sp. GU-2018]